MTAESGTTSFKEVARPVEGIEWLTDGESRIVIVGGSHGNTVGKQIDHHVGNERYPKMGRVIGRNIGIGQGDRTSMDISLLSSRHPLCPWVEDWCPKNIVVVVATVSRRGPDLLPAFLLPLSQSS